MTEQELWFLAADMADYLTRMAMGFAAYVVVTALRVAWPWE